MAHAGIKAPFPYFGGKSRIASEVWRRFGDVKNLIEPFCGSCAVLLARPQPFSGVESVGDIDAHLVNVWRALKHAPEKVAWHLSDPPNSFDMAARGSVLRAAESSLPELLVSDPEAHDPVVAAYWLYCQCCWLNGVASSPTRRPTPRFWRNGMGVCQPRNDAALMEWLQALSKRLRYVRIAHGNWTSLVSDAALWGHGSGATAIFLDPPYGVEDRHDLYSHEDRNVSREVYGWARQNEDNPRLRICAAGYEAEHEFPETWEVVKWRSHGFVSKHGGQGRINRDRERLWFSPACLRNNDPRAEQLRLF